MGLTLGCIELRFVEITDGPVCTWVAEGLKREIRMRARNCRPAIAQAVRQSDCGFRAISLSFLALSLTIAIILDNPFPFRDDESSVPLMTTKRHKNDLDNAEHRKYLAQQCKYLVQITHHTFCWALPAANWEQSTPFKYRI